MLLACLSSLSSSFFFFFTDTATTEIYTLSLHDALPIYLDLDRAALGQHERRLEGELLDRLAAGLGPGVQGDRKSTRLNSSHTVISYAVFCLKKKKKKQQPENTPNKNMTRVQIRNNAIHL